MEDKMDENKGQSDKMCLCLCICISVSVNKCGP